MTKSKHTPAPWKIHNATNVTDSNGSYVAQTFGGQDITKKFDVAVKNARLIAAAPELLAVLESTLDWIIDEVESTTQGRALYQSDIMDAIAKAKGE